MNENLKTIALVIIALSLFVQTIIQIANLNSSSPATAANPLPTTHDHDHNQPANNPTVNIGPDSEPLDVLNQPPVESDPNLPKTTIAFEKMEHDFGNITDGDKVSHVFKFTNTGNEPLIINNARGSCGCTVPSWPKEPIPPGESGEMLVEFDSKNKPGVRQNKVTIYANTDPNPTNLTIKAFVEAPQNNPF